MKLREQPLLCPHCQAELGINVYSKYFIYGTEHIECCPHCQRGMKPEKEPISVFRCFQFGIIFSVLASVGYLVFIEDDARGIIYLTVVPDTIGIYLHADLSTDKFYSNGVMPC